MQTLTRRKVLAYTLLPAIMPRIRELFTTGFNLVPYLMALVYQAVRLLPPGHPYTLQSNFGKFGIRHVIAAAANNLVFSVRNIDQLILFVTLLVGVVVALLQIVLLAVSVFAAPAFAGGMPTNFTGFFVTPVANRPHDLSHMMFDLIFGIPDAGPDMMFGSCFNPAAGAQCRDIEGNTIIGTSGGALLAGLGWPLPIHRGMHQMFFIYNTGLLYIAAMLTAYFAVTIIMETAETGTPFGKRFNKVWAPIRLVVAFGLLIPFGLGAAGLNTSQYIVLYAAKYGAGFANNGWQIFNTTLTGTYAGQTQNLVSRPGVPEISGFLQFMFAARTCKEFEEAAYNSADYFNATGGPGPRTSPIIRPYFVKEGGAAQPFLELTRQTTYQNVIDFLPPGSRQAVLYFGELNLSYFNKYRGSVRPTCGSIVIPLSDGRNPTATGANAPDRGAVIMQAFYIGMIRELWMDVFTGYDNSTTMPAPELANYWGPTRHYAANMRKRYANFKGDTDPNAIAPPPAEFKAAVQRAYEAYIVAAMTGTTTLPVPTMGVAIGAQGAIGEMVNSTKWTNNAPMREKGWAAAGIWYNRIAELNGVMSTAALNVPVPTHFPMVMEIVAQKNRATNKQVAPNERFKPQLGNGQDYKNDRPYDREEATVLWQAFNYWQSGGGSTTTYTAPTGNIVVDFINQLLGTSGLYSIRQNPNIHPLAQLVGVGRALIEASIRNTLMSGGWSIFGATTAGFGGAMSAVMITLLMTIVTITLTMGFTLYYILPFLPFIYFFFAVGGWFKAIFEAMVGAPLWALAHIRIDGPGFAGPAALSGYFLIFEIFLRPILIIFGLLGGIAIFSAQVFVLNNIWDLVTSNLGGFNVQAETAAGAGATSLANFFRGPIDEFFFTVIYTIIVYIMGVSSFKLVDRIPNSIMRWMGQSVQTFNDENEDAGESLSGTATIGAQQAIQGVGGSVREALSSVATSTMKPG